MVVPPDNDVLWARSLNHAYRGSPALCGVSLGVREGEILAVNGPRGSGKTTLLAVCRASSSHSRARSGSTATPSTPWVRWSASDCGATASAGSARTPSWCPN